MTDFGAMDVYPPDPAGCARGVLTVPTLSSLNMRLRIDERPCRSLRFGRVPLR